MTGATPVTSDPAGGLADAVARRWQRTDSLLPAARIQPAAILAAAGDIAGGPCGTRFQLTGPAGELEAAASCEHWQAVPGTLEHTWGAAIRYCLLVQVAGSGRTVTDRLHQILGMWRQQLAAQPGSGDADTAAVVHWPSRDTAGAHALLSCGFFPLTVLAARPAGRQPAPAAGPDPRLLIRPAGPGDVEAATALALETIRFDEQFGGPVTRPGTTAALRREISGWAADPGGWMWLAERDGEPAGMVYVQRPAEAGWVSPMTSQAPAAYLDMMAVAPGQRGQGIGAALAAAAHQAADAAGVAVTLLHHAQISPLSAPFWSRQGYRPLWTCWEARPAMTIR